MSLVTAFLILLLTIGLLRALWSKLCSRPAHFPPGPARLPIIGSVPYLPKHLRIGRKLHIPKLFHYLAQTYGPIASVYLGPMPTIVISDVELLKEAFRQDSISDRPKMRPFHELRYGGSDGSQRGVILSSGPEWSAQRRFCLRQLKDLGFGKSSMESIILMEVEKLCAYLERQGGRPTNLNLKMNISIVNALWVILVGERLALDDKRLLQIVHSIDQVLRSAEVASLLAILFPTVFKYVHPRFALAKEAFESAKLLMKSAINEHLEDFHPEDTPRDFIDVYLGEVSKTKDPGSSFYRDKGLQSLECSLIDLFMGGSETTSTTLVWTFLYLLHHPDAQREIHREMDHVLASDRMPTLQDQEYLPFLNAVMLESLRLSTIVPNGVPHCVSQDTWIGSHFLPKGANVMANLSYIHLDPKTWPEPEVFRPQRFLSEKGRFLNRLDDLVAFSVGRRYCLGQSLAEKEYFLFLAGILHRNELVNPPGQTLPSYKFSDDTQNTAFMRYPPKYEVVLRKRHQL